jgi:hypothetical protein
LKQNVFQKKDLFSLGCHFNYFGNPANNCSGQTGGPGPRPASVRITDFFGSSRIRIGSRCGTGDNIYCPEGKVSGARRITSDDLSLTELTFGFY